MPEMSHLPETPCSPDVVNSHEQAAAVSCVAELQLDPAKLVVAFASMDGECVDQHFGSALGFYVYEVALDACSLVLSKAFAKEKKDGNEDKLKPKLAWLVGADMVYCGSIGGSATKQLITLGIHPYVVKEGPDIEEMIEALQEAWRAESSPSLLRILKNKQKRLTVNTQDYESDWDE